MLSFDQRKKVVIEKKKDHSKKGCIDKEIKPLLNLINSKDNYYTTSSCAGRIVLLSEPKSGKKKDFEWLYVSHSKAIYKDISKILQEIPEETIWLNMEPFIFHVCARSLDDANKFLEILRLVGLKHSGILSTTNTICSSVVVVYAGIVASSNA